MLASDLEGTVITKENYGRRVTAMSEQELIGEVKRRYADVYGCNRLSIGQRLSRGTANQRLQVLYYECQARSRMEIYREVGNQMQLSRIPRETTEGGTVSV